MENWKVVNRDFQPEPGDAIRRINESVRNLTLHLTDLARLYVQDGSSAYGRAAAQGVLGGVIALFAWAIFVGATVAALSPAVMPFWESLGLWTLIHGVVAIVLLRKSIRAFKGADMPTLKSDEIRGIDLENEIRMRGMVP